MTEKYAKASEETKEFYFYLGLLSTKFAIVEYKMLEFLGLLIADDFVLTNTILERNSLSQNIELLKKINKYRQFKEDKVSILIQQVSAIRVNRNLFIHGIWSSPSKHQNDLIITCSEPKILYEESKMGRTWKSKRHHTFQLSYIKKQVQQLDDIIIGQNYLTEKLKETVID
ncbi:MAG: hypothetical protein BGO69_12370 [Bacteroidetes bacterium 46-16]|nr:MAG: hypothetical protein BGO69_12370 [Bacteroidetes bacterium 46-16]